MWTEKTKLLIPSQFICLRNLKFLMRKQICFFISEIHFTVPVGRNLPPNTLPARLQLTNVCLYSWDSCETGGTRIWNAAEMKIHCTAAIVKKKTKHMAGTMTYMPPAWISMSELHVRESHLQTYVRNMIKLRFLDLDFSRLGERVYRIRQTNELLGMIS
jgi:hypothetical protein